MVNGFCIRVGHPSNVPFNLILFFADQKKSTTLILEKIVASHSHIGDRTKYNTHIGNLEIKLHIALILEIILIL